MHAGEKNALIETSKNRHDRYATHLSKENDIVTTILKGHLFVEELLEDIIYFHCRDPQPLKDTQLTFSMKLKLANALFGSHIPDIKLPNNIWKVITSLNKLRNEIAHKIDSPKLNAKTKDFLESIKLLIKDDKKLEIDFSTILIDEKKAFIRSS